jgi:hypothetical protein
MCEKYRTLSGQMNGPSLQTLGKQAKTVAIGPNKLNHVASATAKDKHLAKERLVL